MPNREVIPCAGGIEPFWEGEPPAEPRRLARRLALPCENIAFLAAHPVYFRSFCFPIRGRGRHRPAYSKWDVPDEGFPQRIIPIKILDQASCLVDIQNRVAQESWDRFPV